MAIGSGYARLKLKVQMHPAIRVSVMRAMQNDVQSSISPYTFGKIVVDFIISFVS